MHWVERDGVLLPRRVGGHPALDFCNTWAGWGQPESPRREWLRTYDTLAAWAHYAELITATEADRLGTIARRQTAHAESTLSQARELRASVHTAVLEPADADALARITGFLRRAAEHISLRPASGGPARWELASTAGLAAPVLAVARAAADLLTSPEVAAVSACPGHDCGWLFLDRSGRRRWCSMRTCGNRAKVAAHARRQREQGIAADADA